MGPLAGLKVIEMKGIGPGPYAGMLLADLGAEVTVVERSSQPGGLSPSSQTDVNARGKRSIALDVKHPQGREVLLNLIGTADVFFEGFRPGVAERLGVGPDICLALNPRLVYGRLTGWGQHGPLAQTAGHDINYIAISGVLAAIGGAEGPVPPLNLVGDYAGGSLFLVMGILAALYEAQRSGTGQVIDAAITDGAANLMSVFHGWAELGLWSGQRQSNLLDGAAPHYTVYATADDKFVSVGALEPQFFAQLIDKAGLDAGEFDQPPAPSRWPQLKQQLRTLFKQRTQKEWCDLLEGTDACFAPVLDFTEAYAHHHNRARKTFIHVNGIRQPAPAPRFSRSTCDQPSAPHAEGEDTEAILKSAGYSEAEIVELRESGALT